MELTNLQKDIVNQLTTLYNPNSQIKIDFKAPTGSGKTLMATAFISNLISQNVNDKFIFVIATPSSADLPYFFEQKILSYKEDLPFSNFFVEHIKSPSENGENKLKTDGTIKIIPERNKVYIFGKSSFGKERILTTRGIIDDFVNMIIDNGYKLIYIRDEAHIGGNVDKNYANFESLMQENAQLVIKMTATPNYSDSNIHKVILTEEDLNNPIKNDNKYLLKTNPQILLSGDMTDEDILFDAIKKFKEIKMEYLKLEKNNIYIKPAMLIQVRNDSHIDNEQSRLFNESLEKIKRELNNNGLNWAKYFGNNDKDSNTIHKKDFSLDDISSINSDFDVVIFKIGPSTGWDIPRACMLLQLKKVCSDQLNIQTIGRIKRNCYPNLEKNEITDKFYIYSNYPNEKNNLQVFNAKVKDKFINENFMTIEITDIKDCSKKDSEKNLKLDIIDFLTKNKDLIIQSSQNIFKCKNDKLYYEQIHNVIDNNRRYVTKISNVFQFIKIYKRSIEENKNIFDKCEKIFSEFWKNNFNNTKIYNKYPFSKEIFYITLIEKYSNNIVNLINKNKQFKPTYKVVPKPYNPNAYTIIYSNASHTEKTRIENYLFNTKLNNKDNLQPIGDNENSPESIVFNKLCDIDYDNNFIKVWGKNFTTSKVNGAYIDKNNNLRYSFFDFIIKFNNNALLYIEVKSEKDIDPNKTEMLKGAYAEYFKKENISFFDMPIVISIFKVNTNNCNITMENFYDKSLFDKNLNTLNIEDFMKEIANLKTSIL